MLTPYQHCDSPSKGVVQLDQQLWPKARGGILVSQPYPWNPGLKNPGAFSLRALGAIKTQLIYAHASFYLLLLTHYLNRPQIKLIILRIYQPLNFMPET